MPLLPRPDEQAPLTPDGPVLSQGQGAFACAVVRENDRAGDFARRSARPVGDLDKHVVAAFYLVD